MKKIIMTLLVLHSIQTFARNDDNSFGKSESTIKEISAEKLRYQFGIKGQILVFDKTGKSFLGQVKEERNWNFNSDQPISANWQFKQADIPESNLRHTWDFNKDKQLVAKISQYASMKKNDNGEVQFGKLIKEESYVVENFDSINWVISQDDKRRIVVKFSFEPWGEKESQNIGVLPINGRDMIIYDNKSQVWAARIDNSDGNNIYFGATTHKGSVYLSFVPFKGAKEIGTAKKNRIVVEQGNTKLTLQTADSLLPQGVTAKVYGFIDLNKTTERPFSIRSMGSDNESNFLKHINL